MKKNLQNHGFRVRFGADNSYESVISYLSMVGEPAKPKRIN